MSKQKWRYKDQFGEGHNSLFGPGPNMHLNACVGKNGGPAGFDRYARGYFEAGQRLVKSLQEEPAGVDGVIYPLVMVYRHGVEAVLKYLGNRLPFLCDETAEVKPTHKLRDNWKLVRRYLMQLDVPAPELDQVEHTLEELVQIDPNGETFRYPEARDGTLHLQDTSLINVEVFAEGMDVLTKFFEVCCYWTDDLCDQKAEFMQEQRELEREMADYKALVEKAGVPYVIALFGSFTAYVQVEEVEKCVLDEQNGLFQLYPEVTGLLFFDDSCGQYRFRYIPNPAAVREFDVPSGNF